MEQLRAIIAANISALRLRAGMTQQELAQQLNYTDKAISKWERGESVPDISVLARVAEIFGVTVDYLITDHRPGHEAKKEIPEGGEAPSAPDAVPAQEQSTISKFASVFGFRSTGRFIITLMASAAVWLVAMIVFVVLRTFVPGYSKSWVCFVFAVPATIIVLLIFNILWGSSRFSFPLMGACLWTILAALFVFFFESQPWILFLIGVPAQAIIILWQILHKRRKQS